MKHVFATITFALLLSANQSAAFNGNGLMEQGQTQNGQVDNKAQTGKTAKTNADQKKSQQAPVPPSGGVNDVQLMTPDANADRNRGVVQGSQSQQQPQQQNVEPSQEGGDTLLGNNDNYVPQAQDNDTYSDSKQDNEKGGLFSGGMMKWGFIALAVVVVIYFALRKKAIGNKPKTAVEEEPSAEKNEIAALHENLDGLKAEVEVLKQQNIKMQKDLEEIRKQAATNVHAATASTNTTNSASGKQASSTVLYANFINGMVFSEDDMQTSGDEYTVFVLTVSGNEGTFKVNDAPNAQLYLISNFAYSVASAVEVRSKSASAKAIATMEPGRVRKTGNGWTIVKKAVVELR